MNSLLFRCVRHLFVLTKCTDCGNISYSTFESHHFIEKNWQTYSAKFLRLKNWFNEFHLHAWRVFNDGGFWIIKCEYLYVVFYINLVISNQFLVISLYYLYRIRKFFNRLRARYIGLTDRHGLRFILIFQTFTWLKSLIRGPASDRTLMPSICIILCVYTCIYTKCDFFSFFNAIVLSWEYIVKHCVIHW